MSFEIFSLPSSNYSTLSNLHLVSKWKLASEGSNQGLPFDDSTHLGRCQWPLP